jgi:hypothetical protein
VLLARAVPLHFISANGSKKRRTATRKATVAGILVPNKPGEEVAGGAGVACVSCTDSILLVLFRKR